MSFCQGRTKVMQGPRGRAHVGNGVIIGGNRRRPVFDATGDLWERRNRGQKRRKQNIVRL